MLNLQLTSPRLVISPKGRKVNWVDLAPNCFHSSSAYTSAASSDGEDLVGSHDKGSETQGNTQTDTMDFVEEDLSCLDFQNGTCSKGLSCPLNHEREPKQGGSLWRMLNNYPEMMVGTGRRHRSYLH